MYQIADGLARLLAPDPAVDGRRTLAAPAGRRARSRCTSRCFPDARPLDALDDPALIERWSTPHRDPRPRQRVARRGSGSRRRSAIRSARGSSFERRGEDARAARALRGGSADAVHRLGGRAAQRRRPAPSRRLDHGRSKADGVKCERCWRIVPRLVEPRRRDSASAAPKRSRRRCVVEQRCRMPRAVDAALERPLESAGDRRRVDQVTKAARRARRSPLHESVTIIPGCWTSRTCGTRARRSACSERGGLSAQAGVMLVDRDSWRWSAIAVYAAQLRPARAAGARSGWRSSSAARPAT